MTNTCKSCGAGLKESAERCDLCGTPVGDPSGEDREVDADPQQSDQEPSQKLDQNPKADGVYCNNCGWKNPPGSRFCSRCGSRLQEVTADTTRTPSTPPDDNDNYGGSGDPESGEEEEPGMGRQVAIVIGMALLFVLALYMITELSQNSQPAESDASSTPAPAVEEAPLADQFVPREQELKEELAAVEGQEAVDVRRNLLDLYLAANRLDLAGSEAERIAEITEEEVDWALAGNLYYDMMEDSDDRSRVAYAKKSIAAYKEVLEINPDNLDVRTDMAIAYMYDPDNPMKAIEETNRVLEQDSLHVQANFNRGVMLANINRIDQAVEQFEKVKRIVGDPESPIYERAEQAINSIRGTSPGPPPQ